MKPLKLNVPFYAQQDKTKDCGPVSLQMALEYLGEKHKLEKLKQLIDREKTGVSWTIGLAKASAQLGFKVNFYTKTLGVNPENFELDFYKKETSGLNEAKKKLEKLRAECIKYGAKLEEKTLSLNEILSVLNENCIAIVLLNWYVIVKKARYQGHLVPIVGYDDKMVYIHQPGPADAMKNFPIDKNLFDKARKSAGTDEDILFIYRK